VAGLTGNRLGALWMLASAASFTHRSSSTSSRRSVTRIFDGVPIWIAASIDAPMSSVWMWQFQMPSPPTTTMEYPLPGHPPQTGKMIGDNGDVEMGLAGRIGAGEIVAV